MKIVLFSMPDVATVMVHHSAFHLPNNGIASIGANVNPKHEVYIIDLIRKRQRVGHYVAHILRKYRPDLVGFSAMTWQYATCIKLLKLTKRLLTPVKTVIGGYHATLMYTEISTAQEAKYIDFIVRGEGEVAFCSLVDALNGEGSLENIPSLSYKSKGQFQHNPHGELHDLTKINRPVRGKRRLTNGYHVMNRRVEVIETSRGCTRACNFCSMNHMYGRTYRTFPIQRILADIDEVYFSRRTRRIFITDDNLVLRPDRVIELCEAITRRKYRNLHFMVQADCITMSCNDTMVRHMARAGFKTVFLGIENASAQNLKVAGKGDIISASRQAVALCHRHGIMLLGGMIFGFPDDDENSIIANYRFLKELEADTAYCQILTPYPKTGLRQTLIDQGMVTNLTDFTRYNGIWANVKTRRLTSSELQYLVWLHRQTQLGWWEPSQRVREQGKLWTAIWIYAMRPIFKYIVNRKINRLGWEERYRQDMQQLARINHFEDLPGDN